MLVEMEEITPRIDGHEHYLHHFTNFGKYHQIRLKNFKGYWTLTIVFANGLQKSYKSKDQEKVLRQIEKEHEIQLEIPY